MKFLFFRSKKKHCPHSNLRGIYGDEINQHGFRLECMTCGRLLDGPVSLADKRRDEKIMSLLDKMLEDQKNAHDEDSYGDQDEFWNYGEDKKYKVVESEMYDQRRWVTVYRDVVTHEDFPDEYVEVMCERGSTEMQEGDRDNTTFTKVVPKKVTVTRYVEKKD